MQYFMFHCSTVSCSTIVICVFACLIEYLSTLCMQVLVMSYRSVGPWCIGIYSYQFVSYLIRFSRMYMFEINAYTHTECSLEDRKLESSRSRLFLLLAPFALQSKDFVNGCLIFHSKNVVVFSRKRSMPRYSSNPRNPIHNLLTVLPWNY